MLWLVCSDLHEGRGECVHLSSVFEGENDHDFEDFEVGSVGTREFIKCVLDCLACRLIEPLQVHRHCFVEQIFAVSKRMVLRLVPSLDLSEACLLEHSQILLDIFAQVEA